MVEVYFQQRRQGDLLRLIGPEGIGVYAIVSQTCDVVLPKRETILLAPATTELSDTARIGADDRSNPRYLKVSDYYIDLAKIHYHDKDGVNGATVVHPIDPTDHLRSRDFSLSVGRWFSRFAFPDEVHPWLSPLQKLIRSKYTKEQSPLHQVLQDVVEVRIEADQWFEPKRNLVVHLIVKEAALPLLPTGMTTAPLKRDTGTTTQTPSEVAAKMLGHDRPISNKLWEEFAWSLTDVCRPTPKELSDQSIKDAVYDVTAEVWSDQDFPLARYRQSEQLDIDFLSEPQPS